MNIAVEIAGQEAVERAKAMLTGIPDGMKKALKSATQKYVKVLRSESDEKIQTKFDISAANLRSDKNVKVKYSYQNGVQATVRFSGKRIPLIRFGGASPKAPTPDVSAGKMPVKVRGEWTMQYPGVPASGHQFVDTSPTQFMDAFVARMTNNGGNHIGIFERYGGVTSGGNDGVVELMGDSYAQMVGKQEVAEKLTEEAHREFEAELDRAVYRILTGWR